MISIKEKQNKAFAHIKEKFGYSNVMQSPKISKVIISVGVGKMQDKKKKEMVGERITRITGQKASLKLAKKSIAGFKVRQGDPVGYQVTLRGEKMWSFMEKLINIALPRTKDFRGLNANAVDGMGGITIGIKEHTIFPETADEDVKDVFGLAITVLTTAKTKEETKEFLAILGFPFSKKIEKK